MTVALTAERAEPSDRNVVDIVDALSSPELFELLRAQCGWTTGRFQEWLAVALTTLALDRSSSSRH